MGAPQDVSAAQRATLETASKLQVLETATIEASGGAATLTLTLPRQGVSLLRLEG
jgi:xylan 1,4-beta-xylosidase